MALQQVKKGLQIPSIEQIERTVDLHDKGVRVPVLPFRLPVDPILGTVPFLGDMVTMVLSGSIVWHARQLGASRLMQRKMLINLATDCVVGCIPIVGDVFDFFYKANIKNLRLLKNHIASTTIESRVQRRKQP